MLDEREQFYSGVEVWNFFAGGLISVYVCCLWITCGEKWTCRLFLQIKILIPCIKRIYKFAY